MGLVAFKQGINPISLLLHSRFDAGPQVSW